MSIIYSFLQKRKMHESQHGFIMVFMAYALSALMLALGSDTFYNINSTAAGTSINTEEETQKQINVRLPNLQQKGDTVQIANTELINPYGLSDSVTETGGEKLPSTSTGGDTIWLLGNAMDEEEFDNVIAQMDSLDIAETTTKKTEEKKKKTAASTLSAKETFSHEYADITVKEVTMLERIVEAEASGEDIVGKILIVNVILNRVEDEDFPDTIKGVIFQSSNGDYQFSPVSDERYWSVSISKETKKAVKKALKGEDYSKGALYFVARKKTTKAAWFDNHLDWLFVHGGHDFYKNK